MDIEMITEENKRPTLKEYLEQNKLLNILEFTVLFSREDIRSEIFEGENGSGYMPVLEKFETILPGGYKVNIERIICGDVINELF